MPQKEQFIPAVGLSKESILARCYSCLGQLNWKADFADETTLIASTPTRWNRRGQQITITAEDNGFTIITATTGNELVDISGKNNKNIARFLSQWNATTNGFSADDISNTSIEELREKIKNEQPLRDVRDHGT